MPCKFGNQFYPVRDIRLTHLTPVADAGSKKIQQANWSKTRGSDIWENSIAVFNAMIKINCSTEIWSKGLPWASLAIFLSSIGVFGSGQSRTPTRHWTPKLNPRRFLYLEDGLSFDCKDGFSLGIRLRMLRKYLMYLAWASSRFLSLSSSSGVNGSCVPSSSCVPSLWSCGVLSSLLSAAFSSSRALLAFFL